MAERANNSPYSGAQMPHQPPTVGSMDPPRGFVPPMPLQYRPVVPAPQPPQYAPMASHHFQPAGHGVPIMIAGFPTQPLQPPFRPLMHQLPARPGPPAPSHVPPPPQFAPTSYGQPQQNVNVNTSQYQPLSHMHVPSNPAGGQLGVSVSHSTVSPTPLQHTHGQMAASTASASTATVQHKSAEGVQTDWIEHTSADGRRYYHNKKTRQSTWDKPFELMTITERADASTEWKEFTSPDGRTYYYNKVTKQSKWSLPDELKLARKQAVKASTIGTQSETSPNSQTSNSVPTSVVRAPSSISSSFVQVEASSPVAVVPVIAVSEIRPAMVSAPSASRVMNSSVVANADGVSTTGDARTPMTDVSSGLGAAVTVNTVTETKNDSSNLLAYNVVKAAYKVPAEVVEETRKDAVKGEKFSDALEEKTVEQEQLAYTNKFEAKNAFKALLESANVGSDWTWDQAMRAIINDRRYGALRTLGERKTAFNEFLGQRKKQEAEERRSKQKKAREDYKKMLEESVELTSSTRFSKAVTMFENDERFKALERERDRKDLFDDHLEEFKQKERANVMEERKRNILEYRKFLESCAFIKVSTQWRKVQDRLEADERCSCLEKMDRLEIFQEYLNDLEKEEEEQRKIQKEELSKAERKNRDEFRKLMEVDVASGILTAKTNWRDYCIKVKDLPAFMGVASNTSGSTPKDLFEDVAEELQKQFQEDKTRIKDAVKLRKIALSSTWTFEDFKGYVLEDVTSPLSDVNFKLVFDDLLIKVKEKEEKEAKKRKRLEDDFFDLLCSIKEISASSTWETCRKLLEGSREFSSIGDESICRGIFDEFVMQLKEQAKEYEQKRKEVKAKRENEREERDRRKHKLGRGKERAREREKEGHSKKDGADSDHADSAEYDNRRSGKDDDKKHRKRHQGALDSVDEIEKDHSKNSHRHNSDSKKSRRHLSTLESENESRHKRHKRDHRNDSHKNGDHDDLEDGEFGGAIR